MSLEMILLVILIFFLRDIYCKGLSEDKFKPKLKLFEEVDITT